MIKHELIIGNSKEAMITQKMLPAINNSSKDVAVLVIDSKSELFERMDEKKQKTRASVKLQSNDKGVFPLSIAKLSGGAAVFIEGVLDKTGLQSSLVNLDSLFQYFLLSDFKRPILIIINELQNLHKISPLIDLIKMGSSKNISILISITAPSVEIARNLLKEKGYSEKDIDIIFNNCMITQ